MNLKKPHNPNFSSGPCPKRPNWDGKYMHTALLGRSHRSKPAIMQLKQLIDQIKLTLELPSDFQVGIVPASDTGAFEMAMWNFLGPLPVDVLYWESFGKAFSGGMKNIKLPTGCSIFPKEIVPTPRDGQSKSTQI